MFTVKDFKKLVAAIPQEDDDCPVVAPFKTDIPGLFAFEGICPAVTEVITVANCDNILEARNCNKEIRVFLIATHSFHEDTPESDQDELHTKGQCN